MIYRACFFCSACKVPLPVSLQDNVEDDRNTHDGGNGIEGNDRRGRKSAEEIAE